MGTFGGKNNPGLSTGWMFLDPHLVVANVRRSTVTTMRVPPNATENKPSHTLHLG